jgi:predicted dehydrogenase
MPGCLTFASAEELLQSGTISAVLITTPPVTHVAIAMLALRMDIPVLVEKPLASSLVEAEKLSALVASSGGLVMLGFNRRYWEPVCQLRRMIRSRKHSEKVSAQLVMTSDVEAWSPICSVSDPLDDVGSHQLDLLRYIFEREIWAISARRADTNALQIQVKLAGGVIAECLAALCNASHESITIRCQCNLYHIHLGSERIQPVGNVLRSILDFTDALKRRVGGRQSSMRRSYERQLIRFFHYVRIGVTPHPGIADGVAVLRAVEAARESISSNGREVLV